jgi:arylsulfatase A-like enzyme
MFPASIGAHNMRIGAKNAYASSGVPEYEVVPPPEVRCFPDQLRENGVYTVCGNKTDYQFAPSPFTWDIFERDTDSARNRFNYPQPFFKQVHFGETHESQIWLRKNEPLLIDSSRVNIPPYLPQTAGTRRDWITQYNNLKFVDEKIGKILESLEKAGLLQHTIIIFTGDHGNGLPRSKRTVYESGVKVPMIIRFPDKRMAGTRNNDLAYLMDLGPTILSIYGMATPKHMHGRDLLGKHKPSKRRQHLFFSSDRYDVSYDMIRAVSNGTFKYIRNFEPRKPQFMDVNYRKKQEGVQDLYRLDSLTQLNTYAQTVMRKTKPTEELYDIVNDPYELNNLANDIKHRAIRTELKMTLDDWMQNISDWGYTPEKDIAAAFWPGGVQPITAIPEIKASGEKLSLSCPTPGATIGYKVNDQKGWTIYTQPIALKKGDTMVVMAHRLGFKSSEIAKLTYTNNR